VTVASATCGFEREPLIKPFGFKGAYCRELWQTATLARSTSGQKGLGLSTQSPLWADRRVFDAFGEEGAHHLMFAVHQTAVKMLAGSSFSSPAAAIDALVPELLAYARHIAGVADLRAAFVLNALVGVDLALWTLSCRQRGITTFDELIPPEHRPALSYRHKALACIYLVSYDTAAEDVRRAVREGVCCLKIKIGADPDGSADAQKMVDQDARRIAEIHQAAEDAETPFTASGRVAYILDGNGRYGTKNLLRRLLDRCRGVGAYSRIILVEEPLPPENEEDVSDLEVAIAADESVCSADELGRRVSCGYRAVALKPVAKTLSISLDMLREAHAAGIACYCADLTVNPVLTEWNRNVAARLAPLPGMRTGILESNGTQHYRRWEQMVRFHPAAGAPWTTVRKGLFCLDDAYYRAGGGVFEIPRHYAELVQ